MKIKDMNKEMTINDIHTNLRRLKFLIFRPENQSLERLTDVPKVIYLD